MNNRRQGRSLIPQPTPTIATIAPDVYQNMPPDVIRLLALEMSLEDILNACLVSRKFNASICANEDFWRALFIKNFPELADNLTDGDGQIVLPYRFNTFKEFYRSLSGHTVPEIHSGLTTLQMIIMILFLRNLIFKVEDVNENGEVVIKEERITDSSLEDLFKSADAQFIYNRAVARGGLLSIFELHEMSHDFFTKDDTSTEERRIRYRAKTDAGKRVESNRGKIYDYLKRVIYRYFFPTDPALKPMFVLLSPDNATLFLKEIFDSAQFFSGLQPRLRFFMNFYEESAKELILDALYKVFYLSSRDKEPDRDQEYVEHLTGQDLALARMLVKERNPTLSDQHAFNRLLRETVTRWNRARLIFNTKAYKALTPDKQKAIQRTMVEKGLHPDDLRILLQQMGLK